MIDYDAICFVIMPFGKKKVGAKEVDFDRIYEDIFVPAVGAVTLPEGGGGPLVPRRTDKDFFAGDISREMFLYIEYSRFALADISGLNANVFYELGARHRVRESGTAIFRQTDAPIPFDIQSIKAFPYEYEPQAQAEQSRSLITRVLTESLRQNRIDSPVRIALAAQQQKGGAAEAKLQEVENAIRSVDFERAIALCREAVALDPTNPLIRMRLGLLLRDRGRWKDALEQFEAAARQPSYAEAWREVGIAQNKLAWQAAAKSQSQPPASPAPGEEALRKALKLQPADFDAGASLAGVLKRAKRLAESRDAYAGSREASSDHPYPLLNEIKLRAHLAGHLQLAPGDRRALARAGRMRTAQAEQNPPYDKPWCFFDLAEIRLYEGAVEDSLAMIRKGIAQSEADWQPETFISSLELLEPAKAEVAGLDRCLELLRKWQETGVV